MVFGGFRLKITSRARELAFKYGFSPLKAQRIIELLGESEAEELFKYVNEVKPRKSIRCNTLAINLDELVNRMESSGFKTEVVDWIPNAIIILKEPRSLGSTIEYLAGYYYIQGLASMLPVYLMKPKPNEVVVDLAAAPGGKTTQIAQEMKNKGVLVAVEKARGRLRALVSNIQRMRVKNAIIVNKDMINLNLNNVFDKALLDAPCSGEGLIHINYSVRLKSDPREFIDLSNLQYRMLYKAINYVKPGGIVVYSTCSLAPEENEYVITRVVESRRDVKVELTRFGSKGSPGVKYYCGVEFPRYVEKCLRLYPHKDGTEGFFICILRRM